MMKRFVFLLVLVLFSALMSCPGIAENDEWNAKPVITHIYEQAKEKIFIEWDGNADLYQIYIDGKNVSTVNIKNASIDLKPGSHQIIIIPFKYKSKNVDTGINLNLEIAQFGGGGAHIDLGTFGIDPKDLVQGNASGTRKINYTVSPIFYAAPEITNAVTDFDGIVSLSFTDKYDSNIYRISIKNGEDTNYIEFSPQYEDASALINKEKALVTITLDPEYLKNHECMIPELDQKYSFSVILQKYPSNYIDNTKETEILLESKASKSYDYTPYAAWKNAPMITYASQTADGQITLKWDHEDNGLGCEYKIMEQDMLLGVKKGEKEIGKTSAKEYTINDLMNGEYSYTVVPLYSNEQGISSKSVKAKVENNWVAAPALKCETGDGNQVILQWPAAEGVENYHVTVSAGDGSLLRFVNLDYKKVDEFDVPAQTGNMVYTYLSDQPVDSENGLNLKFEIYGIRHAADGSEQKSETSAHTITLK